MNRKLIVPVVIISISILMTACLSLPFPGLTPAPTAASTQTQSAFDIPATQIVQTVVSAQTEGAYNTVVAQLTQISQATATPAAPTLMAATDTPLPPTEAANPTETEIPTIADTATAEEEIPSSTPVTLTTSTPASAYCDWAMYVNDVTVTDGTTFLPGQTFTKTWRLKNNGTCTWTTDYALVFVGGTAMGGSTSINLSSPVLPGQLISLSVNLTAPVTPGPYTGFWMLRNANDATFGIDKYANGAFWVKINVAGSILALQNPNVPLSFAATYCGAEWQSSAAYLTCPSPVNDFVNGSVILSMNTKLQDGTFNNSPALVVIPNNGSGGMVSGTYPGYTVRPGDRFSSAVGCLADSPNCNITFQLNYTVNGGNQQSMGSWIETSSGPITPINIDLSPYVNQSITFILEVQNNNGSSTDDRGFWLLPQIYRP
ncbi:MAG: NBR1-Ig-like domain-containing protein [Anaerolineaceae bacterium]|nr:NBR1-Ig-like domain-containing protein [Anaerolineaceae bacterium]